ncbi:MAG TPA: hypothetical protein VFA75_10870 [Nevskia sp.]|nr:hypothetical protein [Nevskia sp.]
MGIEIHCPKCRWRPKAESLWNCSSKIGGCGTSWNTFMTRGICPKCAWRWAITQCLACKQWSPHEEWYHPPEPDARKSREAELDTVH